MFGLKIVYWRIGLKEKTHHDPAEELRGTGGHEGILRAKQNLAQGGLFTEVPVGAPPEQR
jgi:hypothetical protein